MVPAVLHARPGRRQHHHRSGSSPSPHQGARAPLFSAPRASVWSCYVTCSGARAPSCGPGSGCPTSRSERPPPGYVPFLSLSPPCPC
jgi:hypothetical protein